MQRSIRRENFAREIGVVQQRSILFKGSIRDNLKWGNDQASDEDLWKAITIAQAKDVVEAKPGKLDFEVEQTDATCPEDRNSVLRLRVHWSVSRIS